MKQDANNHGGGDIVVPLIFRTHEGSSVLSSFEIAEEAEESSSAITVTTRRMASISRSAMAVASRRWKIIILALFILWMIITLRTRSSSSNSNASYWSSKKWPSDDATCARNELHVSFSQLYREQATKTKGDDKSRCVLQLPIPNKKTRNCDCGNPTLPHLPSSSSSGGGGGRDEWMTLWNNSLTRNVDLVQQFQQKRAQPQQQRLDVVLLGDSITELWLGTELSEPIKTFGSDYQHLFKMLFTKQSSSSSSQPKGHAAPSIEGMALGIAGDQTTQLLYRLQKGELGRPEHYPKVWWILVGINNLKFHACNKEVVLVGLIRIIQELQYHQQLYQDHVGKHHNGNMNKDQAMPWIVINSILPVGAPDNIRQADPVLWPSIQWINHHLECYIQGLADQHVAFFNATSLFLAGGTHGQEIDEVILLDGLHPSPEGMLHWGRRIVETVQTLIST